MEYLVNYMDTSVSYISKHLIYLTVCIGGIMYNNKNFYHIYPLGLCGAPHKNSYSFNGDESLLKIIDWIPHMKHLGITSLYLGSIFESVEHGYDTTDYYKVDSRLGTNESLKTLVRVLHENEIDVILDGVFNHVGRDFYAFKDIQQNLQNSQYVSWFDGLDFSKNNPYNDHFTYKTWDGHFNLVKFNMKNRDVKDYLLNVAKFWIKEFNIDGIRLDAADVLDLEFLRELSATTKSAKDNFWLMGEVVHGDYNNWLKGGNLDSTTNYECYKGLYSSLNDANYFEIAHSMKRQFSENGCYKNHTLYNFVDNHDVNRIMTSLKNKHQLKNLYCMMYVMPGIPSVYYGSEWKLEGNKGTYNDLELRPALDVNYMNHNKNGELIEHLHLLAKIRKHTPALQYGNYKEILVKSEQFIFAREHEGEIIYNVFNSGNTEISLDVSILKHHKFYDLYSEKEIYLDNGYLKLHPYSSMILKKI